MMPSALASIRAAHVAADHEPPTHAEGVKATMHNLRRTSPKRKNPPEEAPGGSLSSMTQSPYAFMFAFTASAVIGSARTRAPQALKMALPIAGATTVAAGSPTPVGCRHWR